MRIHPVVYPIITIGLLLVAVLLIFPFYFNQAPHYFPLIMLLPVVSSTINTYQQYKKGNREPLEKLGNRFKILLISLPVVALISYLVYWFRMH